MPMQCSTARGKPVADLALECEPGLQRNRSVFGPQAQVGVERTGVDQLAGVHPVLRVPRVLELAERLHQLGAEHDRQQLALRLAVAVLARERAAVLDHQVRRLGEEAPPVREPGGRAQLEVDARVDAAVAEMAVERSAVAEALDQRLEFPQVVAQAHRVHRRVFPADHRIGALAADVERGRRGTGFCGSSSSVFIEQVDP